MTLGRGAKKLFLTLAAFLLASTCLAAAKDAPPPPEPSLDERIDALLEEMRALTETPKYKVTEEGGTVFFPIPELKEKPEGVEPVTFTMNDCIDAALVANKLLRQKQTDVDKVDGQELVDKSRFRPQVDMFAGFNKKKSTMLKAFYPTLNPPTSISSAGGVNMSGVDLSGGGTDLSSLAGMDTAQLSSLASQFGVDLSQFGFRKAFAQAPGAAAGPRAAAQQVCFDVAPGQSVCVDIPAGTFPTSDQITNAVIQAVLGASGGSGSSADRVTDNELGIQISKRLFEFGKEAPSTNTVRSNLRSAIYNFEQTRREVISNVRKTFFIVLLKKQQILTRRKLMEEYEGKLIKLQKRFEIAKDVPRIDLLTAELDVLNEEIRINSLRTELINKKLELLQLMGRPMMADEAAFEGDFQPFYWSLDEVVGKTLNNSYQLAYLQGELNEQEREYREVAWDYRPQMSGKMGFENRFSSLGLGLNKSAGTYGLDLGAQHYLNVPKRAVASSNENRFFMELGVDYPLHSGTEKKGIRRQELQSLNNARAQHDDQKEQLELTARKAFQAYLEAIERVRLQGEKTDISKRRLEITRMLREAGKVTEFQLDSYRDSFFADQDRLFSEQENVITAQENLRKVMGVFDK